MSWMATGYFPGREDTSSLGLPLLPWVCHSICHSTEGGAPNLKLTEAQTNVVLRIPLFLYKELDHNVLYVNLNTYCDDLRWLFWASLFTCANIKKLTYCSSLNILWSLRSGTRICLSNHKNAVLHHSYRSFPSHFLLTQVHNLERFPKGDLSLMWRVWFSLSTLTHCWSQWWSRGEKQGPTPRTRCFNYTQLWCHEWGPIVGASLS